MKIIRYYAEREAYWDNPSPLLGEQFQLQNTQLPIRMLLDTECGDNDLRTLDIIQKPLQMQLALRQKEKTTVSGVLKKIEQKTSFVSTTLLRFYSLILFVLILSSFNMTMCILFISNLILLNRSIDFSSLKFFWKLIEKT